MPVPQDRFPKCPACRNLDPDLQGRDDRLWQSQVPAVAASHSARPACAKNVRGFRLPQKHLTSETLGKALDQNSATIWSKSWQGAQASNSPTSPACMYSGIFASAMVETGAGTQSGLGPAKEAAK